MAGSVRIGTSGWAYKSWRGDFYPRGLKQREELAHLSRTMTSVELNGSFYSLQRASSYRSWSEQTQDDFVFAVKGSRFVTHMRQLREPEQGLANFLASGLLELRHKLGPLLWQLPARTGFDPDRLIGFFSALPRSMTELAKLAAAHDERVKEPALVTHAELPVRHVVEVRNETFRNPDFPALLRDHGIGLVVSDGAGEWPLLDDVTSDVVYVRLHGPHRLYHGGYDDVLLDHWAGRVRDWSADHDVFVYFDNDADGRAPHDAITLLERLS
jgi:uncharacterized protein YecE (DUF72 family)